MYEKYAIIKWNAHKMETQQYMYYETVNKAYVSFIWHPTKLQSCTENWTALYNEASP